MALTSTGSDAWVALVVVILLLSLTSIIVGLRIYTRLAILKQLGWDDYCTLLTLIVALTDGGTVLSTIPYGLGRHTGTIDQSLVSSYLIRFYFSIVLYNLTLSLIKLTFMIQYHRVLSVHKMKKIIWVLGSIIMMWAVSQLLVVIFTCSPVQKFWDTDLPGHCVPDVPFWYVNAAGNIITDLVIFIIPLPVLGKLHIHKKQKYFLLGIFSLGFFTCAISLIRLRYLKQGADFTFNNVPTSCWSIAELACGITCACLPTLRPLMSKIKPSWMTGSTSRPARQGGYGNSTSGIVADTRAARSAHNSHHTLATLNKNYSKLTDDEIVIALGEPMPPDLIYAGGARRHEASSARTLMSGPEDDAVPLQELPSRNRETAQAKEALGLGMAGLGVTAHVVGGSRTSYSPEHKTSKSLSGIEVKRQVTVTTTEG